MDPLSDIPSSSSPTAAVTNDPLADIKPADTALPDSYREASKYNPDHVARSQEISRRKGVDPNYALANINDAQNAADMPDFDDLKTTSPGTHKLVSNPGVMGKAWDDIKNLSDAEGHAQAGKQASTLLQAALAGFEGSGTGMSLRAGLPDIALGPNPTFPQEVVSAGIGMASDLPQMILGGAGGAPLGPFGAAAGGFALPAAYREFVRLQYTHGNPRSADELLRRAWQIAVPAAKQATVGLAMAATGGGAAALGAGSLLTKGAEVTAMTTANAALEGKYPTMRDLALNAIMLTGAHAAGITWSRMGEAAKASKLRARDAETFADHADNVAGPAYIPVDKWDARHGNDVEDINKTLGIEQAYAAAKATGGDVEIPAGKFLSQEMDLHRDALKDDVKSDPEAKTVNQVKEIDEQRKAEAKEPAKPEKAQPDLAKVPAPDPAAVNVRVIHHGETAIDSSGEPTPEEKAQGILAEPQTHGPKFKDLGLTEKGKEQVQQVAEDLKDHNITKLFSSDSERTQQTARAVGPNTPDPRFSPIDLKGDLDGMPLSKYKPILKEALDAWAKDPDSKQLGNESFNEFQQRNLDALKEATADAKPGETRGIALSSDSVQLFKLIAENGGLPISGEMIKRMAEKESIKPVEVSAYRIDPATGLLSAAGESGSPSSQAGKGPLGSSSSISVDPGIADVKTRADDWLGKEAAARGMTHDEHFRLQYGTFVHKGVNEISSEMAREFKSIPEADRQAWLDSDAQDRFSSAAKVLYDKMTSLREAYPEIVERIPHDIEASERILSGFKDVLPRPDMTPLEQREYATTKAVASAQEATGQTSSPIEGLDPKTQAELDKMQEAARKEAEKILLKPQLEELKAKNRSIIEQERERATAEIGNQVGNEPVFRAFALFNPEGAEHDISQKTIWKKANDYMNGKLSDADELHFEAVSEMSGFASADEMAQKLLLTERGPAFQAAVKERLDKHMAQFADLKDTDAMKAEALKAVHNEQSGELLALQYQIMEGMGQNAEINAEQAKVRRAEANQRWETAKQFARDTINTKSVEMAGRFRAYYTAERDAAVRAEKAMADGDFEEAAKAKQEQLNNHALASESLRVRDNIESWQRSIDKQFKADPATWKDQDHFFQAAEIMKRFGLAREDYDPSKRVENLQGWAERMNEASGGMVELAPWLQDEGITKDLNKLTPPELRDVRNALKNIKHVANAEENMFVIGRGMTKQALVNELHDAKIANVEGGKTPGAGTYEDNFQKLVRAKDTLLNNIISPDTFLSELDGFKMKGPWQDTLIETKDRAMDARGEMNAADAEKWRDIHSEYSDKELREMRSKPLFIPELDPKGRFTKDNLLTLAANQGSEGNQTMAREGRGWTQAQVDAALTKYLSKRDWNLVQAKLDWMESRKPLMADLHRRVTGFEPTWVEAKPIQTPFGEYRGGYYPLISDPRAVSRGFENMKVDASLADPPVTFKAATQQGFLKQRNENARYAVSLDGDGFVRHMSDVTHDLTMREWVIDASRILGDKTIAQDMQDSFGMDNYQGMKTWLKQIAGNDVKPLREAIDGLVAGMRRRSTVSQLGGKLSVMLSQIHGLTAAASVDPENFGRMDVVAGIMNVYGKMLVNPSSLHDTLELVDEKSPYMKQSGMDADRDIAEAARATHGSDAKVMQLAQKGFRMMHDLTMKPLWLQAYKVGLKVNEGDETRAVSYADKIIKGSTTGGRASDLPAMMRGSETGKLLTMFHGFVNAQTQLMYKAYGRTNSAADIPAFAGTYMNVMVLPGAMYALFHYGLPDDRKSQQMWQKALIRSASPLSMIPVVSTLQDWAIDRGLGIPGHASMSPAGGGLDALYDLLQESTSRRAHTQKVLESATKVASYTGFPVPGSMFMQAYPDQYNTWLWNTVDAVHNGMTPRFSDAFKRRPARERHQ